jgi:hypothetical protein
MIRKAGECNARQIAGICSSDPYKDREYGPGAAVD